MLSLKKWEYGMIILSLAFIMSIMFLFWPKNVVLGGDDLGFHLNRILSLTESLSQKKYPFYISSNYLNGYGYAANWFYPDILLLPLALYLKVGGSITFGYKMYLVTVQLLMIIIMYSCMHLLTKHRLTSWMVSWCYVFSSYRLIDQYARGAMGENLAFLFYPFVLIGLYLLLYKEDKKGLIYLTAGFTGLVYTHVLSVVMMSVVTAVFCIFCWKIFVKNPKILCYFVVSIANTLLLGAFALFPMLEQMQFNDWRYKVHPFANLSSSTGYSIPQFLSSLVDPLSFNPDFIIGIGLIPILLVISKFFSNDKESKLIHFANNSLIIGMLLLLMTTSLFPIKWLSILDIVQFSWRLNAISTTLLVMAGGIYFSKIEIKELKFRFIFSTILVIIGIQIVQVNREYQHKYENTVDTYGDINYVSQYSLGAGSEYLPATSSKEFIENRGEKLIELNGNQLVAYKRQINGIEFSSDFGENHLKKFELPLIFYKGYEATVNGEQIPIEKSQTGLIQINTEINGLVQVKYCGTVVQKSSMIISVVAFLIVCGVFVYYKVREVW